jgi:hypothetical protein
MSLWSVNAHPQILELFKIINAMTYQIFGNILTGSQLIGGPAVSMPPTQVLATSL